MYEEVVDEAKTSGDASKLISTLSALADDLRQESKRSEAGTSDLPQALTNALELARERQDEDLAAQCGRVAANLVADNDSNRDLLVKTNYIDVAVGALPLGAKAVIASLLNLVVDGHESASAAIVPHLANLLHLDLPSDAQIWVWTIANAMNIEAPSEELQQALCRPFVHYRDTDEKILELAGEVIPTTTLDDVNPLLDFVEFAEADATIKGNVVRTIVDCPAPDIERMNKWLEGREDMQICALLCYGNRATTEIDAIAVLDEILPRLLPLLVPESSVQLQHACIGLLRNLSVPPTNKEKLHESDIPSRLRQMGVWADTRDMVGSVQGGAVGVVKNLCRDNLPNSRQFIQNTAAVDEVLAVIGRSDDPPTRYEGTRIFVNVIRSGSSEPEIIQRCGDERVIQALCRMFRESGEYPLLLNEAIIALAVLAKFGGIETVNRIQSHLDVTELQELIADVKIKENADMLAALLKDPATSR